MGIEANTYTVGDHFFYSLFDNAHVLSCDICGLQTNVTRGPIHWLIWVGHNLTVGWNKAHWEGYGWEYKREPFATVESEVIESWDECQSAKERYEAAKLDFERAYERYHKATRTLITRTCRGFVQKTRGNKIVCTLDVDHEGPHRHVALGANGEPLATKASV